MRGQSVPASFHASTLGIVVYVWCVYVSMCVCVLCWGGEKRELIMQIAVYQHLKKRGLGQPQSRLSGNGLN